MSILIIRKTLLKLGNRCAPTFSEFSAKSLQFLESFRNSAVSDDIPLGDLLNTHHQTSGFSQRTYLQSVDCVDADECARRRESETGCAVELATELISLTLLSSQEPFLDSLSYRPGRCHPVQSPL